MFSLKRCSILSIAISKSLSYLTAVYKLGRRANNDNVIAYVLQKKIHLHLRMSNIGADSEKGDGAIDFRKKFIIGKSSKCCLPYIMMTNADESDNGIFFNSRGMQWSMDAIL